MRQYPPPVLDPNCDDLEAARVIAFWATGLFDQADASLASATPKSPEFQAGIDELSEARTVSLRHQSVGQIVTDNDVSAG